MGHTSSAGPPTVRPGLKITEAEADEIFTRDLSTFEGAVNSAVKIPISQNEFDALCSITYNIGVAGFRGSTFLRLLNAGDRAGCAKAIMAWTKNKELVSRRTAERDQFLTPYSRAAPKARSTDVRPVSVPRPVVQTVPVPPVDVEPLPPASTLPMAPNAGRPPVPAGPSGPLRTEITTASAGFAGWLKRIFGGKAA